MFQRSLIMFRSLQHAHLRLMYRWLQHPDVSRWYGRTPETYAEVEAKYLPRISGEVPVRCFLVEYDNEPVAYSQTYRIDHDPAYARALGVDRDAFGVDLFIGESGFRYRGFGSLMLQEFVSRIIFAAGDASCCVIAPEVANHSAIRAYQKAGFRYIRTVTAPGTRSLEYVMMLWPDELDDRIAEREGMTPQ